MTILRCSNTWSNLWETFNISVLMICPRSSCWSWAVASLAIYPSELWHLASQGFLIVAICVYYADLSWAWSWKTNVIYFRSWETLQKIFLVYLLMICAYTCYLSWCALWRTCAMQLLRLTAWWILIFVIYSLYGDLLYSWWHIMTNLIHFSS